MDLNLIPLAARFESIRGTQLARIACTERQQVARHAVAFGVFDAKGREIGHSYAIDREFHVIDAAANLLGEVSQLDLLLEESFIVYPQALRDGVKFGALPTASYKRFKTLPEAQAYADKVIDRARKAAAKKASA
jgi:hypothetical protein